MAIPITIPRLGWNMEEGVFVGWLRREGEIVKAGDSLFTLESEKATEDVECLDSGILRIGATSPKAGDAVRVGDVIGYLLQPEEAIPSEPTIAVEPAVGWVESSRPTMTTYETMGLEDSAHPMANRERQPVISPRARRLAAELGVDWKSLTGSGGTGRIREQDVRAAATTTERSKPEETQPSVPISTIRRIIAERMRHSLSTTAPVTLTTIADAENLVALRGPAEAKSEDDAPSFTDILVKLTAAALQAHPRLNSRWEKDRILELKAINVGLAVDTEAGLLAPVIRDVPRLTLKEISAQTRDLAERARQGKLHLREMEGGTFTITNLGSFGIDAFTPIIHWPECAILGVGRIRRQPVVLEDRIEPRQQATLSLTFDHRIVDGADAARFLQTLVRLIENPEPSIL
jgi:pyruvate dehydrogenase E2 component (dihydrolipoamide acetyltransferase)